MTLCERIGMRLVLALALAAGALLHDAAAADTVRIGTNNVISDGPLFIANRKGFFARQGIEVQFITFDSGPKMVAPLGIGQIDVGAGASSSGLFNAVARGIAIKIVADKGSNAPGYSYTPLLVRKALVDGGEFKSLKDLKGRKVAEAGQGGSPGSIVNEALKSVGLRYGDVIHVSLGYPQQVLALENGAIDAAIGTEPSVSQAVRRGAAVRIPTDGFYPHQQVAVLLYGGKFIAEHHGTAERFMVAYLQGVRVYNEALAGGRFAGPAAPEVIDVLARDSTVKDKAAFADIVPNACNPDGHVDRASLAKDLAFFRQQKLIEGDVTLDQAIDDNFVDAALGTLGPYQPPH